MKIGGEAGQGIQTIGDTLAKIFSRSGYHVFTHQDYMSRVRGGHNFYQVRLSDEPVTASRGKVDILVALDRETMVLHEKELSATGIVVYDSSTFKEKQDSPRFLDVPLLNIATESGGEKITVNTVAIGAILGMLGLGTDKFVEILGDTLRKKGEDVFRANKKAALAGYDFAVKNCLRCTFVVPGLAGRNMLIDVNEAIGLGAIGSGCRFYSAYPMTPSTGIMLSIASKAKEYGIVVEQAEDEIAAINMAIGASFAGVRAMTGTSGGGFALMTEGLSLAAMTETPIVIALAQRPGPATGLPTRTEQAELLFALHAGHGEFPRVIFAPGSPEQAFYLTNKAFDLSQRHQIPVFILTDQYLADSRWTYDGFNLDRLVCRDYRLAGSQLEGSAEYKRHAFTDTGVSPFAVPCGSPYLVVTDSDEHDEEGHLVEDGPTRIRMVQKRLLDKTPRIKAEITPPLFYGDNRPDIIVTGWGSTFGIMKEAVKALAGATRIAMLHFSEIFPFPSNRSFDFIELLRKAKIAVCVEQNASGQLARLVRTETGFEFSGTINRYDGRPFMVEELIGELNAYVERL
ncbi:2-oxoacid:acceptor oxidoreductase subunit alpha [Syntrophorhabdus aromaticivorans]|uniref:2-oxoacid:acceptor oxidoreductase subunit alpha n=1 Tax=Syntrophorhabdus aromaticivorans TaxID=328301 RepID=UPI0023586EE6|nr:2-oxoacid:acceptor oxidoreductase subunit alpha [Syntrophorhabdus aromaticivorans]